MPCSSSGTSVYAANGLSDRGCCSTVRVTSATGPVDVVVVEAVVPDVVDVVDGCGVDVDVATAAGVVGASDPPVHAATRSAMTMAAVNVRMMLPRQDCRATEPVMNLPVFAAGSGPFDHRHRHPRTRARHHDPGSER
ncbi:hypothetical protein BMS3Bbin01_01881 [bacterium BMS3Bbin01]|nr:hypothetical protein BMS3Bbin01_01881 [bacterium BMS3Bbin01]